MGKEQMMKRLGWLLALGLFVTGCEVNVGDCDEDDAGRCKSLFPERDASWWNEVDASGIDSSTSTPADAAAQDAAVRADAATTMDGAVDAAAQPDAAPSTLTLTQFCEAQFASGRAWSDLMGDVNCGCLSQQDQLARDAFIANTLRYPDNTISLCLSLVERLQMNGVTYNAMGASACAARFAAQFKKPSEVPATIASCTGGFDIGALAGTIGHGRQALAQLAECRAALVGTKAFNAVCTESLECGTGLRCRPVPGGGESRCLNARAAGETCTRLEECADGLTCSLSVVGPPTQLTCIAANNLRPQGGNCQSSSECLEGLICDAAMKCINAVADRICN